MMIRNAKLTLDTMNAILFQLSGLKKKILFMETLSLTMEQFNEISKAHKNGSKVSQELIEKLEHEEKRMEYNKESISTMFTLNDASTCLAQVVDAPKKEVIDTMLGERRQSNELRQDYLKRIKSESAYRACGEHRHWWNDRPSCREIIKAKRKKSSGVHGKSKEQVRDSSGASATMKDAPNPVKDEKPPVFQ